MKKILFRADGNSETGLGHLYRIFALIEMFRDNFEYQLLTRENSSIAVIPVTYDYQILPGNVLTENEPNWLNENYPPDKWVIVTDGYHFNSSYQKAIKKLSYRLICVDDLTTEYMYADIVINHSEHVKAGDYKAESYTKFAL
jgi:UDP-2,4-diacetamido-2,4,6-trideoxy-beta-L-altropyranose hydrolase